MNITSPSLSVDSIAARSPARSMAGPLVIRSGAPELGRDDHGDGGLAEARRAGQQHVIGCPAAPQRALQHQRQLLAHPGLADELRQPPGPQGALDSPSSASASGDTTRSSASAAGGQAGGHPAAAMAFPRRSPAPAPRRAAARSATARSTSPAVGSARRRGRRQPVARPPARRCPLRHCRPALLRGCRAARARPPRWPGRRRGRASPG